MKRRFYTLDVFTDTPYLGNSLAVVTDGDGLSRGTMQAIAREMNLSETVFVQRPTSNRALARLRIFTTTTELRLAGHPVIGTWYLLAELGVVPAQEGSVHVMQQTGAGVLPIEIQFHNGRPKCVTMTQMPAAFKKARFAPSHLARALGLRPGDLDRRLPIEFVSTGIFNLMVPLHRRALGRIAMDIPSLKKLISNAGVMAYCFALDSHGKVFARGMIPWELHEDPATGSAAGSLGAYLVRYGKLSPGKTLEIIQGVEMGRPSRIHVEVQTADARRGKRGTLTPRVSGCAVRVLEGFIET